VETRNPVIGGGSQLAKIETNNLQSGKDISAAVHSQ
jgi:hypothetical protein